MPRCRSTSARIFVDERLAQRQGTGNRLVVLLGRRRRRLRSTRPAAANIVPRPSDRRAPPPSCRVLDRRSSTKGFGQKACPALDPGLCLKTGYPILKYSVSISASLFPRATSQASATVGVIPSNAWLLACRDQCVGYRARSPDPSAIPTDRLQREIRVVARSCRLYPRPAFVSETA